MKKINDLFYLANKVMLFFLIIYAFILPSCEAPIVVNITRPSDGSVFDEGEDITFSAVITVAYSFINKVIWISSIDDEIWTENYTADDMKDGRLEVSFTLCDLSTGTHEINCYAYNENGLMGNDTISMTIGEPTTTTTQPTTSTLLTTTITTTLNVTEPIIANHNIVDLYKQIPSQYINEVKKFLLSYLGESHGRGLFYGLALLEEQDSRFAFNPTWEGAPETKTDQHLRILRTHWNGSSWKQSTGEEDFWTSQEAIDLMNAHLDYCRDTISTPVHMLCFAWCWDMTLGNLENGWAGRIYYPIKKSIEVSPWDISTTNPCLQDYLDVVNSYNTRNPGTITMYSTGPVDGGGNKGERGYQRWLKNEAIRDWVNNSDKRCLFDYADIICWNNDGVEGTTEWEGHEFPCIHPENIGNYEGSQGEGCHINETGCLRLAKAMWWLLARIAGWDGN